MGYKIFLDTNIILDFFYASRESHTEAENLFWHLDTGNCSAFYSESVITTTAYFLKKDFSTAQTCELIDRMSEKISLLQARQVYIKTICKKIPKDFEDALLYEIALENEMDYFVTSNIKDFKKIQIATLPVVTTKQLNSILGNL